MSFLLDQYNQAWSHYRHTESMRTQYLGFYFTVLIGSSAFALPILRSSEDSPEVAAVGTSLFLVAVQSMSYFACVSVVRMGSVLRHYHRAIDSLTDALEEAGAIEPAMRGVMRTEGRLTVARGHSVSGLAERLMRGAMVIVALMAWTSGSVWACGASFRATSELVLSSSVAVVCLVGACVITIMTVRAFGFRPSPAGMLLAGRLPRS